MRLPTSAFAFLLIGSLGLGACDQSSPLTTARPVPAGEILVGIPELETPVAEMVFGEAEGGTHHASTLAPSDFDVPITEASGPLPVWQTEREAQHAARLDLRGSWSSIYGETAPPRDAVRALGEFEPADAVLLAWSDDFGGFMIELTDALDEVADVYMLTPSLSYSQSIGRYLESVGIDTRRVHFFEYPHESFWTRDYGPITVELPGGWPAFIDTGYYPDRVRDDAVPTLLANYFDVPVYRPRMDSEGGNFMSNGEGLCVVTEWLLDQNGMREATAEGILRDYMGCEETVILERLRGEGTGHVDMFAKFVSEDTILLGSYTTRDDRSNAALLDRNAQRLRDVRLPGGRPLRVVRIPMPRGRNEVYRSYTNALHTNDRVLVPIYSDDRRYESEALQIWRDVTPEGTAIIPVDATEVIQWGGAVHCVTMGFNHKNLREGSEPTAPAPRPEPQAERKAEGTHVSTPRAAIRDLDTLRDVIEVPSGGEVEGLLIEVAIEHTYIGDLQVVLEHDGIEVVLHDREGGNQRELRRTWRVDDFRGSDAAGDWTLRVSDTARQDQGVLLGWGFRFE